MDINFAIEQWTNRFDTNILHNRKAWSEGGANYVSGIFVSDDGCGWEVITSDINGTESFSFVEYEPADTDNIIEAERRNEYALERVMM